MYKFNVEKTTKEIIAWIQDWFSLNGNGNAIVGISGGKDSSVVAALCVAALGKDRVIGVLMPNGEQSDIDMAYKLCNFLNIKSYKANIKKIVEAYYDVLEESDIGVSDGAKISLPPYIRKDILYSAAKKYNGRVANTCNLSEDWVGYATRYGDGAGDFSPLSQLTTDEVIAIGEYLGLPKELTRKVPIDGLCGLTDEDNLGFLYTTLNRYIRIGECENENIKNKIDSMHRNNLFKLKPMPVYTPNDLPVAI